MARAPATDSRPSRRSTRTATDASRRRDPAFARVVVWRDADQDRRSTPGELQSASAAGLVAIDLAYRDVPRCSGGSCEVERARFVFRDARGQEREGDVIDVHLARR